jgi:exodeoxyribonuclease-1
MIWPVDDKGNPTNRLELLTKENGVDHYKAHDALSDVMATIAVARLISEKQPQLFQYLLKLRSKKEVMNLVNLDEKKPFVYTSGRYETEHQKTTVAFPLTSGKNGNVVVYDLRYDPAPFIGLSTKELTDRLYASWEERQKDNFVKLPVKELQYNRAPAVAPLGVLEQGGGWERIHLDAATIDAHKKALLAAPHFAENIRALFEKKKDYPVSADPEAQLYDGFVNDRDRVRIESVRNATERELVDFHPSFDDERLAPLLLHYKARNYPRSLSEDEVVQWESWRSERLRTRLPAFLKSLQSAFSRSDDAQRFVIEELQLWAESIMPVDEA